MHISVLPYCIIYYIDKITIVITESLTVKSYIKYTSLHFIANVKSLPIEKRNLQFFSCRFQRIFIILDLYITYHYSVSLSLLSVSGLAPHYALHVFVHICLHRPLLRHGADGFDAVCGVFQACVFLNVPQAMRL